MQELAFRMMRGVPCGEEAPAVDVEFRVAVSKAEVREIFTTFLQNKDAQAEGVSQKYLDDLLRHHLIQQNGAQVEFRHQMLQEYYAAEYLLAHWDRISEFEFKRDYLNYLKWTEAIVMMLDLTDDERLSIQVVDSAMILDLMLGARLARYLRSDLQKIIVEMIDILKISPWLRNRILIEIQDNPRDQLIKPWFSVETIYEILHSISYPPKVSFAQSFNRFSWKKMAYKIIIESNPVISINSLFLLLDKQDFGMRVGVINALVETDSEKGIPILRKALKDESPEMRIEVVNALGKIRSEKVIPILLRALQDKSSEVRMEVVDALGNICSEKVIPILLKALQDKELFVRIRASYALGKIRNSDFILPKLLDLIHTPIGDIALRTISAIQINCKFYNYELTQTTQSMKLFFSYAHKDEPLRDELAKHLSLLKRQNIITDWHDRNITAGTDWAQAIDNNLNTANIILLLISADFLASDYCYDKEMNRALEHHNQGTARIIPIILRPCDWHSAPFGKLQALPKDAKPLTQWDNPDEAFTHITQGIRKAVEELQQRTNTQPKG